MPSPIPAPQPIRFLAPATRAGHGLPGSPSSPALPHCRLRGRRWRRLSGLLLLAGSLFFCTADHWVDANTLERQLMITWIALYRGDADIALTYATETHAQWQLLREEFGGPPWSYPGQQPVATLDRWSEDLLAAVREGRDQDARLAITLFQESLRRARPHLGLHHPADALYAFHHHWEDVVEASNDPMLCLLEWPEYEGLVEEATGYWRQYQAGHSPYATELFPGLGTRSAEAEAASLTVSAALADFARILTRADHTLAATPSKELQEEFFRYLSVITDYPVLH